MPTHSSASFILCDTHCHFDFDIFAKNREWLWRQCAEKGIQHMLIPGVEPTQWEKAQCIAQNLQGIFMSCGLHPWWVGKYALPAEEDWLSLLTSSYCVAIGECGLDKTIDAPLSLQLSVFERHIHLAQKTAMPLIIHVRQAHNETIQLLKKYRPQKGGVIHGFTGSRQLAMEYWNMGFYLGVGGSITYPRAKKTRATIRSMPLESLLLETDAPDMPLFGRQGRENSPLYLYEIANALAELKQESIQHIAEMTTKNARSLFGF